MELALGDYSAHGRSSARARLAALARRGEGPRLPRRRAGTTCRSRSATASGITQCLMNLAGNALKFTQAGRVAIGVELQAATPSSTASPTPASASRTDELENVFGEFRQVDATVDARVRRHGSRPQHHQEVRRDARRAHLGREHARQGIHLLLQRSRCESERRGRMSRRTDPLRRGQRVQPQNRAPAPRRRPLSAARGARRRERASRRPSSSCPTSS